jgi:hypothetical protein
MTIIDRMKMLTLASKDLNEAVKVYADAKAERKYVYAGCAVPLHCSKEAIKRRITQMRQDLLLLEKEL